MSLIKFISGDGVEHVVDENSPAAAHMITSGFRQVDMVYTEADAIAQNDGVDASTAAKAAAAPAPAAKPAAKKAAPKKKA